MENQIEMPYDIVKSILSLRPGSLFSVLGNTYDGISWSDENELPIPTEQEVYDECLKLQQEWEYTQYQRLREKEYPDFREYLDGVAKGDQAQIQSYIDKCLAVKTKYPKPEGVE